MMGVAHILEQAKSLYLNQQYDNAKSLIASVLEREPTNLVALERMYQVEIKLNSFDKALDHGP